MCGDTVIIFIIKILFSPSFYINQFAKRIFQPKNIPVKK